MDLDGKEIFVGEGYVGFNVSKCSKEGKVKVELNWLGANILIYDGIYYEDTDVIHLIDNLRYEVGRIVFIEESDRKVLVKVIEEVGKWL